MTEAKTRRWTISFLCRKEDNQFLIRKYSSDGGHRRRDGQNLIRMYLSQEIQEGQEQMDY